MDGEMAKCEVQIVTWNDCSALKMQDKLFVSIIGWVFTCGLLLYPTGTIKLILDVKPNPSDSLIS